MKATAHVLSYPLKRRPTSRTTLIGKRPLAALLALLISGWLAACSLSGGAPSQTITLVTIFPTSGASGAIGQAMSRAVDLAVKQNTALGNGYTLTATHVSESSVALGSDVAQAVVGKQVMGAIGPFDSAAAATALPALAQAGVATVSPTASLPGLTKADQAATEGLTFSQLHPTGKPSVFFRLTADDNIIATAAANLALASPQAHGLGAHSVFVVDDGSLSGKVQSGAFQNALKAGHGIVAGSRSINPDDEVSLQSAVSAIIGADPDSVFFAGDPSAAAHLRRDITQTGAPKLPLLIAGAAANNPAWSDEVGASILSGATTGLLSTQDLTKLPSANSFVSAYQNEYPGAVVVPQSALAYDAAMVEINAIKSLLAANKTPTRAAVLNAVAATKAEGATGQIAFDKNGDRVSPPAFAVYTCDSKGAWVYQASVPSIAG